MAPRVVLGRWIDAPVQGALALTLLGMVSTCVGPMAGPAVCGADAPCPAAEACVVGRCRHPAEIPAASQGRRLVLEPTAMALLTPVEPRPAAMPELLELGADSLADAVLLLRFAVDPREAAALRMAVLELSPTPDCAGPPASIDLRIQQVRSLWQPGSVSAVRLPELELPMHAARYATGTMRPLRIDVTELVRQWAAHPRRYHGLALSAERHGPMGSACFGSGSGTTAGPTLALYLYAATHDDRRDAGTGGDGGSRETAAGGGSGGGATDDEAPR